MSRRTRWIERRALAVAVAAVGAVAIAGTALAGHQTSGVKSYTGCLVSGEGVIIKIKEGNAPRSACTGGQVEAHFSGGDITKISVTGALTMPGGATSDDNGEVTIGLKPEFTLPSGCSNGEVAKWNGSVWACAADNDTTYANGTGLILTPAGPQDTDDAFSIHPDYRVKNTPDCPSGQFATGFSDAGAIQCSAPSGGVEVVQKTNGSSTSLPKGEGVDLIIMPVQAGTYLVTAVARIRDGGGDFKDEEVSVVCGLRNAAFAALPVEESEVDIGEETGLDGPAGTAVVHGAVSLSSPDSIRFTCKSSGGDSEPDQAFGATLTAIKVAVLTTP